jgi:hypothetical protein
MLDFNVYLLKMRKKIGFSFCDFGNYCILLGDYASNYNYKKEG